MAGQVATVEAFAVNQRIGHDPNLNAERTSLMIFGMTTHTYTLIHVVLSLIGIASGFVAVFGMLVRKQLDGLTALFLATTVLTNVTGFGFPFEHLSPANKVGILSLILLALAITARYIGHLEGSWRWIYVITATIALYFNVFVLVVQSFQKVPALKAMAPTQSEPPFLIAQLVVLAGFIVLGIATTRKFRLEPVRSA